ncbi:MAG: hypothetical protein VZR09_07685 [Candidatus Gastranaerophilaceae bacterium]|nr:hypothetical protein [Candidatus Gastranaerophilaceae bacterium]
MKKILILFTVLFSICLSGLAIDKKNENHLSNTNFVGKGYLSYDLNSFKYNHNKDMYFVDVMEEMDPGGDIENIICPYGEGYITHLIYSTKYSPTKKIFKVNYKGFMCSTGEYEYKNSVPMYFEYKPKGIYYDTNHSIIPNFNMDYFNYLKKEINDPNEYNYFGVIKNLKKY